MRGRAEEVTSVVSIQQPDAEPPLSEYKAKKKRKAEALRWLPMFEKFIDNLAIDSKETGIGPLKLYRSQRIFLEALAAGLEDDVRNFTILKARQLGISTIMLAIDLFWMMVFPGTQGALVTDDEANRENFRNTLERYLAGLPKAYRIGVRKHNREMLVLSNGSVLYYIVAGTKKKGAMGVGRGLNFVHATEVSRYGDPEAWASFVAAFAEQNPNRLYVYESTARGYNLFHDIWTDAREAVDQKAVFIGWWSKEIYRVSRGSKIYRSVIDNGSNGKPVYTEEEKDLIAKVKSLYNEEIDDEQVAWYRHETKKLGSDAGYIAQEHPWWEGQAFMMSGRMFFPNKQLGRAIEQAYEKGFKGYRYSLTEDFLQTAIEPVKSSKLAQLRIWEEPDPEGVYALGADPAYGSSIERNDWNDRFSIQVLRCYADRVVQVAEYADDNLAPHQFAWVLAHLAGYYRNCRVVLEINGPGVPVFQELKHLRQSLQRGTRAQEARERGIDKIFDNLSYYLYRRQDSLGSNFFLHMKTTGETKNQIMSRMKDMLMLNMLDVGSVPLVSEMERIVQDGTWIGAEGKGKDDRTLAFALALRAYDDWLRSPLVDENRTFENEQKRLAQRDHVGKGTGVFGRFVVEDFFAQQEFKRTATPNDGSWLF